MSKLTPPLFLSKFAASCVNRQRWRDSRPAAPFVAIAAVFFLGICGAKAQATGIGAEPVLRKISSAQLQDILTREGYSFTAEDSGTGDKFITWKVEGFKTQLFLNKDQQSIQFHTSFSDVDVSLKKANEWNKTKKFSKTYLDDDGDPHLELDLELDGGITQARIEDFLKTCRVSFDMWRTEVLE